MLEPGSRLGGYEIVALVGSGGMGEVYRARDLKLGRDVAIKVLPAVFTRDPERLARLRREAQVLAALNHPHIAQIHGLEQANELEFLILELVEGETLAQRIAAGPLPLNEALAIAGQIADAVAAAHEKGIIHRDLKPANVVVTADGAVKVLDFGLAKALESDPALASPDMSAQPTITSPAMTALGIILGTAAYMAPEQAKGRGADKRSDIWAFGCVLYEMLTGTRAFDGDDVSDTLAAILRSEPDWRALPASVPPIVRTVLTKCLAKDRRQRFIDISTPLFLLTETTGTVPETPVAPTGPRRPWQTIALVMAGAMAATALTLVIAWLRWPLPPRAIVTRFEIPLATGETFTSLGRQELAISHDGSQIAFVANGRVNVRSMDDPTPRTLVIPETPTDQITSPVFSPDGASIVYYTAEDGGALKRVPVTGGKPVTLCAIANPFGVSWTEDGILVGEGAQGVLRVSPLGGQPQRIIEAQAGELIYGPQLLPDGDHVILTTTRHSGLAAWDSTQIVAQSLKTGARTTVLPNAADGRYVRTGHLLYASSGVVMEVSFDPKTLRVLDAAVPVLQGVRRSTGYTAAAQFAVSDSGTLAYIAGAASDAPRDLDVGIFDMNGHAQSVTPAPPANTYEHPRVSHDGRWLAVGHDDGTNADIWICDLTGATAPRQLTFGGRNVAPVWSADSRRVVFQSNREGDNALFWQAADGSGAAVRLTRPEKGTSHVPESAAPDGKSLLLTIVAGSTSMLSALSLADHTITPFDDVRRSSVLPLTAAFSPRGTFVAYDGENGVFVQPFPPTGAKYFVMQGIHPFWSPDGTALFASRRTGPVRAAVTTTPVFTFGAATEITTRWYGKGPITERDVDMMPDGSHFVGIINPKTSTAPAAVADSNQVEVVVNWFEELHTRTGAK